MESVAQRAGVAVQTVYFVFHTKAQLMVESLKISGGGSEGTADVMARSWIQEVMAAPDGARRLALAVEHGSLIYQRLGPLWPAVLAAMDEPDVQAAWSAVVRGRRDGMRRIVGLMFDRGELRPALDVDVATDILFALHRHELYLAFTNECGWSFDRYRAWTFATLCWQLLPGRVAERAVKPGATATIGLGLAGGLTEVGI
jgi:AcrR family transcriptional regulator